MPRRSPEAGTSALSLCRVMCASSRVLAALTLSTAILLPALPAAALPGEDPAPGVTGSTEVKTPSGQTATIQMVAKDGAVTAPPIAADSWVLADLDSGQILASLNPDLAVRPASTLKLLTALTVAPRLAPEQPYRAVAADEVAEGNRVVLYKGLTYTVADLMNAALMPSANDAAEALARANGGVKVTVEQMNAEAARLGATRTTAKNPSGLDADGQVTTAHDMALIGRAALANREVAESLLRRQVDFPGKMEKGTRVIYPVYNHNRTLVNRRLEGYLGGKSGFTSKAGNTMVAGAEKDGRRLLVTLFHIGGNGYRTSETLLKWGFANADKLSPVGTLADPSAPAPQFDRAVLPLPEKGKTPVNRDAVAAGSAPAADAPTAPIRPRSLSFGLPGIPMPSLPSPLTILTLLVGVLVLLRARVYWIGYRSRTAWTSLDAWASTQARSARRRGPADRRVRTPRSAAMADEGLIGASK